MRLLFVVLQYLVPQHAFSRLAGWFAESRVTWLKKALIHTFIMFYKVDMSEAKQEDPDDYACFNDFFTRELKSGARPIADEENGIISPADGWFGQCGELDGTQLLQAKGMHYSTLELLGGDRTDAARFDGGSFVTVYLSPRDYHRVHMPMGGTLTRMRYIPGKLFSVNQATAESVPRLFARNERLVCLFDTNLGQMALVMVGAMIVAGIDTVWSGPVCPTGADLTDYDYNDREPAVEFTKGDEMGRFRLGSTVIVLFEPGAVALDSLQALSSVKMGQQIARAAKRIPGL
ncbi:MAG: archaetidylserine decarboxylase [Pseudohongiellaceae bacterium]